MIRFANTPRTPALLAALRGALRARDATGSPTNSARLQQFEEEAKRLAMQRLPAADLHVVRQSSPPREQALAAARNGDSTTAERLMQACRAGLDLEDRSAEGRLLLLCLHEAAEAYLVYRRGEYDAARDHLLRALAATSSLQDEHGYLCMEARRVHLALNVIQVEVRRPDAMRVMRLCSGLLHYLAGDGQSWPFPECGSREIPPLSGDVRSAFVVQTLEKIADTLPAAPECQVELLGVLASVPSQDADHAWLRMKRHLVDRQGTEYLREAAAFVRAGTRNSPTLWRTALQDLHDLCGVLRCTDADLLRSEIREMAGVPPV